MKRLAKITGNRPNKRSWNTNGSQPSDSNNGRPKPWPAHRITIIAQPQSKSVPPNVDWNLKSLRVFSKDTSACFSSCKPNTVARRDALPFKRNCQTNTHRPISKATMTHKMVVLETTIASERSARTANMASPTLVLRGTLLIISFRGGPGPAASYHLLQTANGAFGSVSV